MLALLAATALASPPRAVVSGSEVLACWDGAPRGSEQCPLGPALAVGVAPLDRTIALESWGTTLTDAPEPQPCTGNKHAADGARSVVDRRPVQALPLGGTYQALLGAPFGLQRPTITQLVKLDLEGDGVDEVLFAISGTDPTAGAYHICGLRQVRGAKARTLAFLDHRDATQRCALEGVTDLDGDGTFEVVVAHTFPSGYANQVYRVDAAGVRLLGMYGCGG